MQEIIERLEKQGMSFEVENDTKDSACKYIKYNTSWNMLKQSRNILYLNVPSEKKYLGVSFYEIRTAGLVHFYFNQAIEIIVKEFEHGLKVYMSDVYQSATEEERSKVFNKVKVKCKFAYKDKNIEISEADFFEIYTFATLKELVSVYKVMRNKTTSYTMPVIDSKITRLKNSIYHHNNVLFENKSVDNSNICKFYRAKMKEKGLNDEIIDYLEINYQYNSLRFILDMMMHVDFFLSRDECTSKRKKYMYTNLKEKLDTSNRYYKKLKNKSWVTIYFESIGILINHLENGKTSKIIN